MGFHFPSLPTKWVERGPAGEVNIEIDKLKFEYSVNWVLIGVACLGLGGNILNINPAIGGGFPGQGVPRSASTGKSTSVPGGSSLAQVGGSGSIADFAMRPPSMPAITQVRPPSGPGGALSTVEERIKGLADILETSGIFSGVILVQEGTREPAIFPVSSDQTLSRTTPFNICSGGKMFTSVAIHQLAEAHGSGGDVNQFLDQPLSTILTDVDIQGLEFPEMPSGALKSLSELGVAAEALNGLKSVTIRSLLNHTSGVKGGFFQESDQGRGPLFDPSLVGKHVYSNVGYSLLGAVVEKLSSKPVNQYIQEMLEKNGILVTSSDTPLEDSRGMGGQVISPSGLAPIADMPAPTDASGGWIMDAENMSQFLGAVHSGAFFTSPETTRSAMFSNSSEANRNYASGFDRKQEGQYMITGHTGSFPGQGSQNFVVENTADHTVTRFVVLHNSPPRLGIRDLLDALKGEVGETFSAKINRGKERGLIDHYLKTGDIGNSIAATKIFFGTYENQPSDHMTEVRHKVGTKLVKHLRDAGTGAIDRGQLVQVQEWLTDPLNDFAKSDVSPSRVEAATQWISDKLSDI